MEVDYVTEGGEERTVETSRLHREIAVPAYVMQEVFARVGPVAERGGDWWKCQDEPWRSLAGWVT